MNETMLAKVEVCVLLSHSADEFKMSVKKVTGLTNIGFENTEALMIAYRQFQDGVDNSEIYKSLPH